MKRPLLLVALLVAAVTARAAEAQIAVAANFAAPMQAIKPGFERSTGHRLAIATGSTGKLYAQIRNGAPFDVFLAADDTTPQRLERDGAIVPGSRIVYATGRLALWSARDDLVDDAGQVLRSNRFRHLALAAPALAPYGAAALQTLERLGLRDALRPRFVQGESVGQTYGFIASGNAELGFVALSQVWRDGRLQRGSAWVVPADHHQPLRQEAVLLKHGARNPAAVALLRYIGSPAAQEVIRAFGYEP